MPLGRPTSSFRGRRLSAHFRVSRSGWTNLKLVCFWLTTPTGNSSYALKQNNRSFIVKYRTLMQLCIFTDDFSWNEEGLPVWWYGRGTNSQSSTNVCLYEQVSKLWPNFGHFRLLRSLSASCFHMGSSWTTVSCVTSTGWNFLRTKICIRGIVTQETAIQARRIPNSKPTESSSIKTTWLWGKS